MHPLKNDNSEFCKIQGTLSEYNCRYFEWKLYPFTLFKTGLGINGNLVSILIWQYACMQLLHCSTFKGQHALTWNMLLQVTWTCNNLTMLTSNKFDFILNWNPLDLAISGINPGISAFYEKLNGILLQLQDNNFKSWYL